MGKKERFFDKAEKMFVKDGKTCTSISELLGVSEKTLSEWRDFGAWDKQREEYLTSTRQGPVDVMKKKLAEMLSNPDTLDAATIDSAWKLRLLIKQFEESFDLQGAAIEVMDRFIQSVKKNEESSEFIEKLSEHVHRFFEEVKDL